MRRWTRHSSLAAPTGGSAKETWTLQEGDELLASYPVEVQLGKDLDVLKLRTETSAELRSYVGQFRDIVERLYDDRSDLRTLDACPCCFAPSTDFMTTLEVYGARYVRCTSCGHVFVKEQPLPEKLFSAFSQEEDLSVFYIDPATLEMRMRDIVQPKIDWVLDTFQRFLGRRPSAVLDVGAGGGHFVAGCRRNDLQADGVELSTSSVRYAQQAFNLQLVEGNYLGQAIERGRYDLLTFWGLLEYAPEPDAFFKAARAQLEPGRGMLVLEVPRCDSLCLAVQEQFTDTIWRHAMPDSHMNLYSDASLATLLHNNGFRPVAAWYFGMDVYELLMQIGLELDSDDILQREGRLISPLQKFVDRAQLADDIVVAAIPVE